MKPSSTVPCVTVWSSHSSTPKVWVPRHFTAGLKKSVPLDAAFFGIAETDDGEIFVSDHAKNNAYPPGT